MSAQQWTPVVEAYLNSMWRELPVRYGSGGGSAIVYSRGRTPESFGAVAGSLALTIDNTSGTYSPSNPVSEFYGHLRRNTPIRVAVRPNALTGTLADASDDFSADVAEGWGTADVGGAWSFTGSGGTVLEADTLVDGGEGLHGVPAANAWRASYLAGLSITDCTQAVTFECPTVTGADLEPAGLLFRGTAVDSVLRVTVAITTAAAVTLTVWSADDFNLGTGTVAGLTHDAGVPLRVEARTVGRHVMARVWDPAGADPTSWDLTVTDTTTVPVAGWIGVRSGRATSNSNTVEPQFAYDNYAVTVEVPRWAGEISSWPVAWDPTGVDVTAGLDAGGLLRRLGSGRVKPLDSALTRAIGATTPTAWWPLEAGDGRETSRSPSALPTGYPLVGEALAGSSRETGVVGGSVTGPPGADGATDVSGGGQLRGRMVMPTDTTTYRWETGFRISDAVTGSKEIIRLVRGETEVSLLATDTAGYETRLEVNDADTAVADGDTTVLDDGAWHHVRIDITSSGGGTSTDYELAIDGTMLMSGTAANVTFGWVGAPYLSPSGALDGVSHAVLWTGSNIPATATTGYTAFAGHAGETAAARMVRLCAEQDVPFALIGDAADTPTMGPQGAKKFLDLITECAVADGGTLFEPAGWVGLCYRTRRDQYAQAAVLALDYSAEHLSEVPTPAPDDQLTRNLVTAKRDGGGEYTSERTTGGMSTLDPEDGGIGLYDESINVNVELDTELRQVADWALALGSATDDPRYPAVEVELHRDVFRASQTLSDQVRAVDVDGRRVTLANLPSFLTADDASVLAVGLDERLDQFVHRVEINCAPARIWDEVAEWNSAARYDSEDSTCNAAYVAGTDTSLVIATSAGKPTWTITSAQYPILLRAAGAVLRLETPGTVLNLSNAFLTSGDTTGWQVAGATMAYSTAYQLDSSWGSLLITPDGASASGGISTAAANRAIVTAGTDYRAEAWVYSPAGWTDLRTCIDWYAGAAFVSTSLGSATSVSAGAWTELIQTLTAPATADRAEVRVRFGGTPAGTDIFYAAAITLVDPATISTTSPQTFTTALGAVNGVVKTIAAGESIRLATPARYGR